MRERPSSFGSFMAWWKDGDTASRIHEIQATLECSAVEAAHLLLTMYCYDLLIEQSCLMSPEDEEQADEEDRSW